MSAYQNPILDNTQKSLNTYFQPPLPKLVRPLANDLRLSLNVSEPAACPAFRRRLQLCDASMHCSRLLALFLLPCRFPFSLIRPRLCCSLFPTPTYQATAFFRSNAPTSASKQQRSSFVTKGRRRRRSLNSS